MVIYSTAIYQTDHNELIVIQIHDINVLVGSFSYSAHSIDQEAHIIPDKLLCKDQVQLCQNQVSIKSQDCQMHKMKHMDKHTNI